MTHRGVFPVLVAVMLAGVFAVAAHAQPVPADLDVRQFVNSARHVDTAGLQKALDESPTPATLYWPAGVYQFVQPGPLVLRRNEHVRGAGKSTVLVIQASAGAGLLFIRPANGSIRDVALECWGPRYAIAATRGPGTGAPANGFRIEGVYIAGNVTHAGIVIQGCETTAIRDTELDMQGVGVGIAYTSDDHFGTGVVSSPNWTCSGHLLSNVTISAQRAAAIAFRGEVTDVELQRCWIARSGPGVPFFLIEQDLPIGNWGRTPKRLDLRGVTFESYASAGTIVVRRPAIADAPTFRFPWPSEWETAGSVSVVTKK